MHVMPVNYRQMIREKLIEKKRANPRFSLRSFARQIGVKPAHLSFVINGKRNLSEKMADLFAERLQFTKLEARLFSLLVRLEKAETSSQKKRLLEEMQEIFPHRAPVRDLAVDQFVMISEWHHFALLVLIGINTFKWSVENAAKTLRISTFEVQHALERMQSLELIELSATGRPIKLDRMLVVRSPEHAESIKRYHRAMLEKAVQALDAFSPKERISHTQNISLSGRQLKVAAGIINDCIEKVIALSKEEETGSEVYAFSIHGFALTRNQQLNKKGRNHS